MSRASKLREKDTRMPDPYEARRDALLQAYLQDMQAQSREAARSERFGMLLKDLLGQDAPGFIRDYLQGKEIPLRTADRLLQGRADQLFGNVVLEFEADLTKPGKQKEAEAQLQRYVAVLWTGEPADARRPYLALATDGVRFRVYSPTLDDPLQPPPIAPQDVRLHLLEEVDWRHWNGTAVYLWLDRIFRRQEVLSPTSEVIEREFGLQSHAFRQAQAWLTALWRRAQNEPGFGVLFRGWEQFLRFVYGSDVASVELFVRHTYLATLAKLMAWMRLRETHDEPTEEDLYQLILGEWFRRLGIYNFIDEDFFVWPVREPVRREGLALVRRLFSLLRPYNLRGLSEDVFKALYQELVDPETRHDLGEFYTPDWLAHAMVEDVLRDNPHAALLDPACGSGTFLYTAIREKRRLLSTGGQRPAAILKHILRHVQGVDIHPLAVLIARTNYLLALGDLLQKRTGPITLPVYLADTLRLPEWQMAPRLIGEDDRPEAPGYRVTLLDDITVTLPEDLLRDPLLFDRALDLGQQFARGHQGRAVDFNRFRSFLRNREPQLAEMDEAALRALFGIVRVLKRFLEEGRDSIWAFILKNLYKPLFLRGKFDLVVGNPPWIAFRYMEPHYQAFLREQIAQRYRLERRGHLITHMEVATLFLVRAADLYLKPGGRIAFVLPKSVFTADQHDGLRRMAYTLAEHPGYGLHVEALWDLEDVEPLFNISACTVFARLVEKPRNLDVHLRRAIPGRVYQGKLPRRNASPAEAEAALRVEAVQWFLHRIGGRSFWAVGAQALQFEEASPYAKLFDNGATIYPRPFWFVRVRASSLGFDPNRPPLETDPRVLAQAKAPYNRVRMQGSVERAFLYATLLSEDLLPFGHRGFRLVVLPLLPREDGQGYELLTAEAARERGYLDLAAWLERTEALWQELRGSKASKLSVYGRLNYQRGLTRQSPKVPYQVVYNTSGTHLAACVVDARDLEALPEPRPAHVVIDHTLFLYETSNFREAHYLAAVLNTPFLNQWLKPLQARGLWGARHIHKKVWAFPIPLYNTEDERHRALVELSRQAHEKVRAWLATEEAQKYRGSAMARRRVREMLGEELRAMDRLVQAILK